MKFRITKKTLRLAAYGALIGGLALAGIICFGVSQYQKAKYASSSVILTGAQSQLKMAESDTTSSPEAIADKKAWFGDIAEHFELINNNNANAYKGTAIPAYVLTTLSLVACGLCLKHADYVKEKEEAE